MKNTWRARFEEWLISMSKKPFNEETYLKGIKSFIAREIKKAKAEVVEDVGNYFWLYKSSGIKTTHEGLSNLLKELKKKYK